MSMKFTYHGKKNKDVHVLKALNETAYYAAELIKNRAKSYAPSDTGALRKSIEHKKTDRGYNIGPDTPYDIYVEFGTGLYSEISPPHYIYPRHAKMLSWIDKSGNRVFAKRVRGSSPQPYMRPALDASRRSISDFLGMRVRRALTGA